MFVLTPPKGFKRIFTSSLLSLVRRVSDSVVSSPEDSNFNHRNSATTAVCISAKELNFLFLFRKNLSSSYNDEMNDENLVMA